MNGTCMECMVKGCILCEVGNPYKCDVCMIGLELSDDSEMCVESGYCPSWNGTCSCEPNEVMYEG